MSQRASAPSESVALAAAAAFHALALLMVGVVVQPWTLVRAAVPADAWVETELVVRDPPIVEDTTPPPVSVASTEAAAPRTHRPPRREPIVLPTAAPSSEDTTLGAAALPAIESETASPGETEEDEPAQTGGGEAAVATHERCRGDSIEGLWHGFAIHTMANYRDDHVESATTRNWFFHADAFLWIRRVGTSLRGASMVHEWSSATRDVTEAPCASRDFDHVDWMTMEGELDGLALRMRNTDSAANVQRAGACGERQYIDATTRQLRSAGTYRFEVQRVADDELTGLYRGDGAPSELQMTRQACIGDVRWPSW